MKRNEERVAFVTGASSGIGEATAQAFARCGMRVAVAARRTDQLETLVERIGQEGGEAIATNMDVTDEQQVQATVRRTQQHWGRLDILVNSAGLMLLGPIAGADTEDWRRMISTNLLGLLYATHAVLPLMKAQKGGHIVNISSVAGRIARAGSGVYNATKWGVGAFSERLLPFAEPFMALFGRKQLLHRSTLSRFLAALDETSVEVLRACFQSVCAEEQAGGEDSSGQNTALTRRGVIVVLLS